MQPLCLIEGKNDVSVLGIILRAGLKLELCFVVVVFCCFFSVHLPQIIVIEVPCNARRMSQGNYHINKSACYVAVALC